MTTEEVARRIYSVRKELRLQDEPDTDHYMAEEYIANWQSMEVEDYARMAFKNELGIKERLPGGSY